MPTSSGYSYNRRSFVTANSAMTKTLTGITAVITGAVLATTATMLADHFPLPALPFSWLVARLFLR